MRRLVLDLLALGGAGVLLVGVHQVYPPAALMVGGLGLCVVAMLARLR